MGQVPGERGATRREATWGTLAVVAYLAAAVWVGRDVPFLPLLYDGLTPLSPYRWVHPPPGLVSDARRPEPGALTVPWTSAGSPPATVTTWDGQCTVILKAASIAPHDHPTAVRVEITPLDPENFAPPPPGLRFDSNAYRVDIRYEPSGLPVVLEAPATVLLRAATGATQMVQWSGSRWVSLPALGYPLAVVVVETRRLGTFALVVPHVRAAPRPGTGEWGAVLPAALAAALVGGLYWVGRSRSRRRRPGGPPPTANNGAHRAGTRGGTGGVTSPGAEQ